jgi:hypothetical protein
MIKADTENKLINHFKSNLEYTPIASICAKYHYLSLLEVFQAKIKYINGLDTNKI